MTQLHSRRRVLGAGAAVAAVGAMPWRSEAGLPGVRGPVLTYSRTGFFTAVGGFPSLLAYDDGMVAVRDTGQQPSPTPWQATVHQAAAPAIRGLLQEVRATGLFRSGPLVSGGSGYDMDGVYVEATVGGRREARFDYVSPGPEGERVRAAAKILDDFIAGLGAGKPYVPAGFVLELGEIVPDGVSSPDPVPWPLARTAPLRPLRDGSQPRFVLPARAQAALLKTGRAYYWNAVRENADQASYIRWRPLYPHE